MEKVREKHFLDYNQAAELLHLKRGYLYKLVCLGRIPCYRPGGKGGRVLFAEDELLEYIARGKVYSRNELAARADAILNAPFQRKAVTV